jgi:hypothetical protein
VVGRVPWSLLYVAYFSGHHEKQAPRFIDLQQGNQLVYAYSKMFNHLAQYAPEQVDTDKKKKYHFINGLSTKFQEHLTLNTD